MHWTFEATVAAYETPCERSLWFHSAAPGRFGKEASAGSLFVELPARRFYRVGFATLGSIFWLRGWQPFFGLGPDSAFIGASGYAFPASAANLKNTVQKKRIPLEDKSTNNHQSTNSREQYFYGRFSPIEQARREHNSIETQENQARLLYPIQGSTRDFRKFNSIHDNGWSAKDLRRPGMKGLIRDGSKREELAHSDCLLNRAADSLASATFYHVFGSCFEAQWSRACHG